MRLTQFSACVLIIVASIGTLAAEPAGDPLLDDLKTAPPAKSQPATVPADSLAQRLQQELAGGEDIGEEEQSLLVRIARRMKLSQELIAAKITSEQTQELQQLIADDLAQLVEQAKQQGQSGSGQRKPQIGKQSKSGNPMGQGTGEAQATQSKDSSQRIEPGQPGPAAASDPREVIRRLWGHLPEKIREQMLNAPREQFLPKYEKLIEAYYKRLLEE